MLRLSPRPCDRQLRSDLIHLASRSTPEVRKALLPLLKKTAGWFVPCSNWSEAVEGFCREAGLPGAVRSFQGGDNYRLKVPSELQSLFKNLRVELLPAGKGASQVSWKYDHAGGGSNGYIIGTIWGDEAQEPGYRLDY